MENEKVFAMPFAKVYGLLVAKAERKGRSKEEVCTIIHSRSCSSSISVNPRKRYPYFLIS